jgi:SAM-dependent methyltransferase
MSVASTPHLQRFLSLLRCPACGSAVVAGDDGLRCQSAGHAFPVGEGIPRMFVANDWNPSKRDVTTDVRAFYEETPFPNYDETDSVAALLQKSRTGRFARLLDEQLPLRTKVLEVGCGTGQLSNFLGIAQRDVVGTDMCINSLRLAEDFRRRQHLDHVGFFQMNLFRPIFPPETFDLVVSNGVLHHTSDPRGGFDGIARLVKKGGYIIIGLYNKYGRLFTDLRRSIFRATGRRFMALDPYLRQRGKNDAKTRAWFADQYQHPHESKHTMGEVLRWFAETGFQFVNSVPTNRFMAPFTDEERLFAPRAPADRFTLAAVQAHMIITGNREGGLFVMIGQRG